MNAKAAICQALLNGEVLSIKTAFKDFGVTNLPREISRQIEKPFNVVVSRVQQTGFSKYNQPCTWFEYRLNSTEQNADGMILMQHYIDSNK